MSLGKTTRRFLNWVSTHTFQGFCLFFAFLKLSPPPDGSWFSQYHETIGYFTLSTDFSLALLSSIELQNSRDVKGRGNGLLFKVPLGLSNFVSATSVIAKSFSCFSFCISGPEVMSSPCS